MKVKVIAKKSGQFMVKVVAGNGEPLVWSEAYATRESALHCVEILQRDLAGAEVVEVEEE